MCTCVLSNIHFRERYLLKIALCSINNFCLVFLFILVMKCMLNRITNRSLLFKVQHHPKRVCTLYSFQEEGEALCILYTDSYSMTYLESPVG